MIKRLLFFCIVIIVQRAYAQITITGSEYANLFEPGKTWVIYTADSLKGITMNVGEASNSSQVWNLPTVLFRDTTSYINVDPKTTPFTTDFPKATHASSFAVKTNGLSLTGYLFFTINDNVVISLGGGTVFNGTPLFTRVMTDTLFRPPLTMGSHQVTTDTVVNNQGVIVVDNDTQSVDAFGTINLPNGTFDALRSTSTTRSRTYVDGHLTSTALTKNISFITKFGTATIDLDSNSQFSGNSAISSLTVTVFGIATSVDKENSGKVNSFVLEQNYPNPFNPVTIINYSIPSAPSNSTLNPGKTQGSIPVSLKVYDILGREVSTLVNKEQNPGNYQVKFDGSRLSSGMYLYRLQAGDFILTKKMQLLK